MSSSIRSTSSMNSIGYGRYQNNNGGGFFVPALIVLMILALAISLRFFSISELLKNDACVAQFRSSPQHTALIVGSGEKVTGNLQIIGPSQQFGPEYNALFELDLPNGTIDDHIEYDSKSYRWSVEFTTQTAQTVESDAFASSKMYIFDQPITWPQCNHTIFISKLTTRWLTGD